MITKVGFKGEVEVQFGFEVQPVEFNSSSFKIWTKPEHNLTWTYESFDGKVLHLEVNFSEPLLV